MPAAAADGRGPAGSQCERCTLLLRPDVSKRPLSIWRCAWLRLIATSLGPIIIKLETRRIVEEIGAGVGVKST
jgi:hypothetical protein